LVAIAEAWLVKATNKRITNEAMKTLGLIDLIIFFLMTTTTRDVIQT
jgi:hypothetical protein